MGLPPHRANRERAGNPGPQPNANRIVRFRGFHKDKATGGNGKLLV
jgi:hypothetical protein